MQQDGSTENAFSTDALKQRIAELEEKNESLKTRIRSLSLDNRELSQLINTLLEQTPFGIIILDNQRRLMRINKAAETILKKDRVKTIGKECSHLFRCYENDNKCPVLNSDFEFDRTETVCHIPNGYDGDNEITLLRSTMTTQNGGEEIIIEAFVDISEIKRAQLAIIETAQAKDDFLAKMSHELRTPLNAIIGYSDLILFDLEDNETLKDEEKYISDINKSGKHMLELIDQLLDITKIKSLQLQLSPENISIEALMRDIEARVKPQLEINENQLHININDDIDTICIDTSRLKQLLLHLLRNACKFTHQGDITLGVRADGHGNILFIIRDTGIGMSSEQQQRVFQAFEQGDNSRTRRYGGAGLGLYLVKELVYLMRGDIHLESAENEGTSVTISLPIDCDLKA